MNIIKCVLPLILIFQPLTAGSRPNPEFDAAYEQDGRWPSHIRLTEDLLDDHGKPLVRKSIPLVLVRAYADGELAAVDRTGTILIDHTKTDFLDQVAESEKKQTQKGDAANFLHQIGRRVFDFDDGSPKAVSESKLADFDAFLICRTSSAETALEALLSEIDALKPQLESRNIEPILVFEELMPNKEFYEHLESHEISHPVVVPVFQTGFLQAIYTNRESDTPYLLINKTGKLLRSAKTVRGALDE